jgi:pSer/pThr/pTyr-binding forkhead associated (FHA) protein/Zn-dependent protease
MLCRSCRRQVPRRASHCPSCGAPRKGATPLLELVLPDQTRVPLAGEITIGRARGNTIELTDPSVSRRHARIRASAKRGTAAIVEDAGSSYGTWLDGRRLDGRRPLRMGSRLRVGNQELVVDRQRAEGEAGRTILVPAGQSLVLPASGEAAQLSTGATSSGERPRLRSGYALKRLDASEGPRRWVLRDLVGEKFLSLTDDDAALLGLLDGSRSLGDLVREAERRLGPGGPARLAQLLAELGERGLLHGSGGGPPQDEVSQGAVSRLLKPRQWAWAGAGEWFERLYERGGWLLFTRTALTLVALIVAAGIPVYAYLLAGRYGTPFVVANKIGIGGLVFVLGRFALVAAHETAHALTMSSFGRRVHAAGLKLVLVFPYAYVDTSEAWFEPRRRRMAVSAAGPVSDLTFGGAFALTCLALPAGLVRDVFFQLAFAAYLGALFNLNPLLERDGYQVLADLLREPALRRRSLAQLQRRLSGGAEASDSPALARYGLLALAWTAVAAAFAATMSLRYEHVLATLVPPAAAWTLLAALWLTLFTPVFLIVLPALRERRRVQEA